MVGYFNQIEDEYLENEISTIMELKKMQRVEITAIKKNEMFWSENWNDFIIHTKLQYQQNTFFLINQFHFHFRIDVLSFYKYWMESLLSCCIRSVKLLLLQIDNFIEICKLIFIRRVVNTSIIKKRKKKKK